MTESNPFDRGGASYAAFRPDYPATLTEALAARCERHRLAIDVGCGTGQLTRQLAAHFDTVVGRDDSASQLRHAGASANTEYRCEKAEALSGQEGSADLITVAQAAHWFELPEFYARVRHVAHADGLLALISYGIPTVAGSLGEPFARWYHAVTPRYWPSARQHVESGYANLPFPFREQPFPALLLERQCRFDGLLGYIGTWSATRRAAELGVDLVDNLKRTLPRTANDAMCTIRWPLHVRMGHVHH